MAPGYVEGSTARQALGSGTTWAINLTAASGRAVAAGDWVLLVLTASGNGPRIPAIAAGWRQVLAYQAAPSGTAAMGVWIGTYAGLGSLGLSGTLSTASDGTTAQAFWGPGSHADPAQHVAGTAKWRSTAPAETTTCTAGSVTAPADSLTLAIAMERTAAAETTDNVVVSGTGWTKRSFFQGAAADTTLTISSKDTSAGGASGVCTTTYTATTHAANGVGLQISLAAPPAGPATGLPVKVTDGAGALVDGEVWVTDGADGFVAPSLIRAARPYPTVTAMLAETPFRVAHRGGSANWPEMTMHAYTQAVFHHYGAMELSVARTSDGVWFGLHDQYLDRTSLENTSGTTLQAASMTWAQVQARDVSPWQTNATGQPHRPYMRLEDLLGAYAGSHVVFIDPKHVTSAGQRGELLDLMDSVPGSTERLVAKYYGVEGGVGNTGWASLAAARGYERWGYFYETDLADLPAYQGRWSLLGMADDASQAAWDAVLAYGKPVIGHIITSASGAAQALSRGADGLMVANVLDVPAL